MSVVGRAKFCMEANYCLTYLGVKVDGHLLAAISIDKACNRDVVYRGSKVIHAAACECMKLDSNHIAVRATKT